LASLQPALRFDVVLAGGRVMDHLGSVARP
jgi:hypothetical protein